ncbi:hypothetical protein JCM39068_42510 [Desulfocastanea catecholica]
MLRDQLCCDRTIPSGTYYTVQIEEAGNLFGVGDKEPARPNDKNDDMTQNKRSSAITAYSKKVR